MELWDVYNKDRVFMDKTIKRREKLGKDEYHTVVHVCIFNSKNEMLIQQRQPFKEGFPNMWDVTVGGSSLAGETSSEAANREVLEEIGYSIDLSSDRPFLTINFEYGFDDYYIIEKDIDITKLTLQYEEVKVVKWADKNEILKMIDDGLFIPYYKSFIEMIFEMRKEPGAIQNL